MNDKESGYRRNILTLFKSLMSKAWFYSLVVVVMWGLVPNTAKAANFPGGFTTFWVNVFSTIGVLVIMIVTGETKQFADRQLIPRFTKISLIWPLAYSIAYFSVIKMSSGSMATLMNYLWPLFAIIILSRRMRIPRIGMLLTAGGFVCVAAVLAAEGNLANVILPVVLVGLIAPVTQACFNVVTDDDSKYGKVWLLTFVGAVVTALGSAIYVLLFEGGQFTGPDPQQLLPLAVIGIGGNAIGFYAFVKASQLSKTPAAKIWFTLFMFLVPFAQVLLLISGVEPGINPLRLVGIVVVAIGFLVFKLWQLYTEVQSRPSTQPSAD